MKYIFLLFLIIWINNLSLAQTLQEDFSDGNFSANPTWVGTTSDFIVNVTNELQTDNLGVSASSELSTPAAIQDSTFWEFYVRMDFAPSTSNYTRVYLQSDEATLSNTGNGYFLQIGSSGSSDSIEIYRVDAGSSTKIFGGTNAAVATNPNVSFRIIRDNAGVWEVFADYTGGNTYVSEGTFTDATHNTGAHFGFFTSYTTTRGDKFFFDNIYISPLVVDVTPPSISSTTVISATEVDVLFDEVVDLTSANLTTNYTINNGVTVNTATRDASNLMLVHLTTSALTSALQNTITINGVEDLNSNAIVNGTDNFTYYNVQAATFQDIIINEIHADPSPTVGLPNAEFVELLNRSNKIIDLGGMLFNDGSDKTLPSFLLFPDSMVVLTASANVSAYSSFGTTLNIGSLTLTNGGELVTFKNALGQTIDSVDYDDSWYQDAVKDDGGWTLELINPNLICQGAINWIASNNPAGGTPGQENSVYNNTPDTQGPLLVDANFTSATQVLLTFNEGLDNNANVLGNYNISNATISSVNFSPPSEVLLTLTAPMVDLTNYIVTVNNVADCSGNTILANTIDSFDYYEIQLAGYQDLIITEIHADPTPVVGLPNAEFVEIYNRSNKTLDLANYALFESSNHLLPSHILRPGEYVILCTASNQASFSGFGTVVPINSLSLTNSGELLMLINPNGTTLDSLEYNDTWYQDNNKDDGGWTLELINPNLLCKGSANWIASNNNTGGTPGVQNSVYDNTVDNTPPSVINTRQYGPNQILIEFDDALNKNLASLTSSYSIDNGAIVVTVICLSNNEVVLTLGANMVDQTVYTITLNNLEDCVGNSMGIGTTSMTYYESGAASHYDLIINEIMADPNPPVGLPEKEYVEIYNRSNKTFNLENFTFTDASSVTSTLPFFILGPGEYVTIYSGDDTVSFASFGHVLPVSPFPDLNTSDELVLQDQSGEVIDAVAYELSWYQNADKDDGGWSLERINPDRPCEAADNWKASENLLGGTPSTPNSVLNTAPDVQSPDALRAFPLSPDSIRVYFSEAIADVAGATASNYSFNDGNINITSVFIEPPLYNSVTLLLDRNLDSNKTYIITINSRVTDCVGNSIALKNTARVALPVSPKDLNKGDFILNEILFNPVTGGKDFIELYNRSNKVLNTADFVLSNQSIPYKNSTIASSVQTRPVDIDWLVFPNEYVVITEDADQIREQYYTPNPELFAENDLPTYDDKEGTVFLYAVYDSTCIDSLGNPKIAYLAKVMDLFDYSEDYHSPLIDDQNGVSLERIDFDAPTNDPNNWHSAATKVGYATPAYQNSSFYANDIDGSDLIQLPNETVSPDGDGYEDFLLINYNVDDLGYVATIDVYDATGRLVRNLINGELLAREGSLQWDGTNNEGKKARVGIHILAIEIFRPDGTVKRFKKTCIVAGRME
ncbi:lamin tail domain-containing protein [Aureispira sp. CCB-E]|uniref:lamin tail domain-containing protein n=1 Tax=Aureispira sp. CCB-E TaxID=3051121 RepID=UPI002868E91B|nr:lamin tail domain-containing protein [Aureispira sp. CCB-E]WMX15253.1 lamin tail domain-containing protein [Aureispira sp. CCB-E]